VAVVLLVEGDTDRTFFRSLCNRFFPDRELQYEVYDGKDNLKDAVEGHLVAGSEVVVATRDLDEAAPERVSKTIRDYFAEIAGRRNIPVEDRDRFALIPMPVGLPQDEELAALGISRHSMDDFLLKLAFLQDPRLKEVLAQLLEHMKGKGYSFPSSKELFQLAKPFARLPANDNGAIERLFGRSDANSLRGVCDPLVSELESVPW
jgi:hypothetical protein